MLPRQTITRILGCIAAVLLLATLGLAQNTSADGTNKTDKHADASAVNQACSAEAQTAGCGSETVGKGLLKCIHAYKKAHSDFKLSPGCRSAMQQLREDSGKGKGTHAGKTTPPPQ